MTKRADKVVRVQAILDEHFPAPAIPLQHGDPFTLLVAVVLSAQCTDERVNAVTPVRFARAATPAAMAEVPVAEIRVIRELSRRLVSDHGGIVSRDLGAREALPGAGHKAASVVMAQAFAVPAFPVDARTQLVKPVRGCVKPFGMRLAACSTRACGLQAGTHTLPHVDHPRP